MFFGRLARSSRSSIGRAARGGNYCENVFRAASTTCVGRTSLVGAARALRPFPLAPLPLPSAALRSLSTSSKGAGVVEVTDDAEYSQALASKGLCVVYFTATWCPSHSFRSCCPRELVHHYLSAHPRYRLRQVWALPEDQADLRAARRRFPRVHIHQGGCRRVR